MPFPVTPKAQYWPSCPAALIVPVETPFGDGVSAPLPSSLPSAPKSTVHVSMPAVPSTRLMVA